ncbi:ABC transporter permease [candidate division KSB1 bacterium]|nr:MAG: ABC transporter permease [candidate division KSB1 bacterium]
MKRMLAIAFKEFLHIKRDVRSLALAVAMPLMMVFLYGYALDMEMKNLKVGILDLDHSTASRDLVRRMTSSNFIVDAGRLASREEIEPGFRRNRFKAAVVIPVGFENSLQTEETTPVQLLIDGADGTTAAAVDNYLKAVIAALNRDLISGPGGKLTPPVELRPRVLYNPELISAHFVVPGLASVILIMICVLLTSIAIVREKETGTMEQVLTTPVHAAEVIFGKVIPYVGIGALDATLVLLMGRVVFGVPMAGSWWVLAAYSLLYIIIALALGLLISAVTHTQQMAMIAALLGTLMPSIMLSGFIFPISSMPWGLQALSHIIPARYYIEILRGIMLRGELWFPKQLAIMTVMAVGLLLLAAKKFQSRLDLL